METHRTYEIAIGAIDSQIANLTLARTGLQQQMRSTGGTPTPTRGRPTIASQQTTAAAGTPATANQQLAPAVPKRKPLSKARRLKKLAADRARREQKTLAAGG